ncbi:MAG TPA: sulfotransferase family 2 domain-containing protein [Methyloceanibacter sp.]|nr:sulfotransferase family 2 domain-containing protein [Methyloceanibacter sp.]
MIISHKHRFIFLKTRKTAGTTVELVLRELCGPDDIITPLLEDEEAISKGRKAQNYEVHGWWGSQRPLLKRRVFRKAPQDYGYHSHIVAKHVRHLVDEDVWNGYFKFSFDRNPWDRQVSDYHFRYRKIDNPPTFAEHVRTHRRARMKNYDVYSIDGEPCVDFMGRFESLEDDLKTALDRIGVALDQDLPRAKAGIRKTKAHYRDYYDDELRETIARWYAPEIRLLGYEF